MDPGHLAVTSCHHTITISLADVHLMDTAKVRYKAEEGTRFGTSTRPTLATIKL